MFGYVVCNKKSLSKEEQQRYQHVYCGLCKALGKNFGPLEKMSLSFDMTFLALFLSALYEPEEEIGDLRCAMHPIQKRQAVSNKYIDYAADMSVALTYYKCLDDWDDEKNAASRAYGAMLREKFKRVENQYPRQCRVIAESIRKLQEVEKNPDAGVDEAVKWSGKMLSEVFVYQEDFWSDSLRRFGYNLGRFIYLMDATDDYKKDMKKHSYNPLRVMGKLPEEMEPILMTEIGHAAQEFERLPIVQDEGIIKNILYGGVWQKYYAKVSGKENKHGG